MANDKNLYRGIRLGRIVNSNGRVIGSIVKKGERKRERDGKSADVAKKSEEKRQKGERQENGMGSKMGKTGVGLVSIIFYPKTALRLSSKSDIVNMQRSFGKMGWRGIRI